MMTFKTKELLVKYLLDAGLENSGNDNYEFIGGTFTDDGNQYARPYYTIKEYKDGWGIHATRNLYANSIYFQKDGRGDPVNLRVFGRA